MMRPSHWARVVALCLCAPSTTLAAVGYRTVALSGQPSPSGSGEVFSTFGHIVLNASGNTSFLAKLAQGVGGVTSSNDSAIWAEKNSSLSLVAREGMHAAGTPSGATYAGDFVWLAFNDVGDVAFQGTLATGSGGVTSASNQGLWSNVEGPVALLAREGSPVPGMPVGVTWGALELPALNNSGDMAFRGSLALRSGNVTTENDEALWTYRDGSLSLVARELDQAPGVPTGTLFGSNNLILTTFSTPEFNDSGHVAFTANIGGAIGPTNTGVWSDRSGSLDLILRAGSQAPGAPIGTNISTIPGFVKANESGQIADQLYITGGDVTDLFDNGIGIWAENNGSLQLVARGGQQAPGLAPDVKFSFLSPPSFNDAGRSVFYATLRSSTPAVNNNNNEGLWSNSFGELSLVVREGDQAPTLPDGAVFSFNNVSPRPLHNNYGQVRFPGFLRPNVGGVTTENDGALWVLDIDGTLQLIVREGDPFLVGPGDVRTILAIGPGGGAESSAINDDGTLAFVLKFTDGSQGVFTATVGVPEPTSFAMASIALSGLIWRRTPLAFRQ